MHVLWTVQPQYNEPPPNKVPGIMKESSALPMVHYKTEPRRNKPWYNKTT